MPEHVYITTLGRSPWAVINTFYEVLRLKKYQPTRIVILVEESYTCFLDDVRGALQIISEAYGLNPCFDVVVVQDAEIMLMYHRIHPLLKELLEQGDDFAVDITGGRKTLVVALVLTMRRFSTHIFYLEVIGEGIRDVPLMMKPLQTMQLHDFIEEAKE